MRRDSWDDAVRVGVPDPGGERANPCGDHRIRGAAVGREDRLAGLRRGHRPAAYRDQRGEALGIAVSEVPDAVPARGEPHEIDAVRVGAEFLEGMVQRREGEMCHLAGPACLRIPGPRR